MLNTVSRSFRNTLRSSSRLFQTGIFFSHFEITKQLGFTEGFQQAIQQKLNKKQKDSFLRLEIFAGQGCEGFTYKFKFDTQLKDTDYVYKIKTNQSPEPKIIFAANGQEMKMLKGATIDYAEQMMRQIFYVKENPNAEISCSCKTSFSPKDYVF